ncbi:MAG: DUF2065 domain-containing protein [Gammaproteobacteria bacterium]|nr:DUF2065 domain-containing protein [Gammaproteobacteria bacterium]MCP5459212.1 DUF2065 domain-containing protein [Gammaproteobacteria bacterium]
MWHDLLAAFGLMLVLEGIFPFLNPRRWRELFVRFINSEDHLLRMVGLSSMVMGLLVLYLARGLLA